ncbi:MAG: PIN domain-containing protein [Patescibacteria group bacterium]
MRGKRLLLDTNILIAGCTAGREQKTIIADVVGQNDVCICDTVFWEFMRNCNANTFRERMGFLGADWAGTKLLDVVHEDADIKKMHQRLWLVYLFVLRKKPLAMVNIPSPDLWIAASCVHHRMDNILTTDHSGDYPDELFTERSYPIGRNITLHLKTFRRERARELWREMQQEGKIEVAFEDYWK